MSKNGLELSVEVGVSMDTDPPSGNFLDVSNSDREVFLVKVPAQLAAQWASYGPEEHIGTIVFPSDASKVRIKALYSSHLMIKRPAHV